MAREGIIITIGGRIQGAINALRKVGAAVGKFAAKWGAVGASLAGTAGLIKSLKLAMNMEQWEVSMATLLGDTELAKQKISELVEFAKRSPFSLPQVQEASKLLLATGTSAENLMNTMQLLGDVAAGSGADLNGLALAYAQVQAKGRLMGGEIIQFAERGIPILETLGKMYGKSTAEILKLSEAGQISSASVTAAFQAMTAEGGRFNNAMASQSETLAGRLNNLMETWDQVLTNFGKPIAEFLKPELDAAAASMAQMEANAANWGAQIRQLMNHVKPVIQSLPSVLNFLVNAGKRFAQGIHMMIYGVSKAIEGAQTLKLVLIESAQKFGAYLSAGIAVAVNKMRNALDRIKNPFAIPTNETDFGRLYDIALKKMQDGASAITDSIRGSADYWRDVANESVAAMEALEPPTIKLDPAAEAALNMSNDTGIRGSSQGGAAGAVPPLLEAAKAQGKDIRDAGEEIADGTIWTRNQLEALEKLAATAKGQASGTGRTARRAIERGERAALQESRGNLEEAARIRKLAEDAQRRALGTPGADDIAKQHARDLRGSNFGGTTGPGGSPSQPFGEQEKGPTDPRKMRGWKPKETKETAGDSKKPDTTWQQHLKNIDKNINERLPQGQLA